MIDLQAEIELRRTARGNSAPLSTPRDIVVKHLASIEGWLTQAQGPLNSLPTPKNEVIASARATALQYFEASKARIAEARNMLDGSEFRQAVRALSTILEIADTLEQIKRDRKALLPLFSQALSEYLALLIGPRLAKLPPLSDVKGLARKVLDPVKDIAESGMLKIADPQKPVNPKPALPVGYKFSIPSWQVPGSSSSLVAHIHKVAEAVEAVLQQARQSDKKEDAVDDASRVKLAMLGHHALEAENQLHRATIALRLTGTSNAIADFDESEFQASVRQADAAYQALERLGESMAAAMQQLVQDLGAIPITKVLDPIVTCVRTVVRETLGWLMDRNQSLKGKLEEVDERWAKLLVPWTTLSETYHEKMKEAFDFADRKNSDWLEQKQRWLPSLPDPVGASKVTGAAAVTVLQRLVSEQVMAWVSSLAAPSQVATNLLLDSFRPMIRQVADAYKTFFDMRNNAYVATFGTPAEWVNDALLVAADPNLAFLRGQAPDRSEPKEKEKSDQLYLDSESLRNLRDIQGSMTAAERLKAVRFLDHFVTGWRTGQSTPLRIAKQVQRISLEEIRSKLMALIDFSAIREEIEERIKLLIPTATTLSYDFSTSIKSAAGGSGKEAQVFRPKEGCALNIKTRARINLLDASKPSFQSIGELGAFDIQLLGSFKAITLHFKGVRFASQGGAPDCDLQYDGFEIGDELRFLEQLTPFFGSKAGSGFYLQPLSSGIGLEAGYGLNLGTFNVGNLAIFNVSLNAAARLPFDNREATFVAALSRRDSPFTIAVAPYGGSGFFALEANTKGIVGFEASFEYGGAAAFKYGPLEGQGRLMVGAYIRSGKGEPKIFATFYVGGSASIWIFSFGASLYVNATQEKNGRNMVGSATYTFSFSMGIVDFDYRVNVDVNLPLDGGATGGKNEQKRAQSTEPDIDAPVRLAAIDPDVWSPGSTVRDVPLHLALYQQSRQASARQNGMSSNGKPKRRVKTVCPSADWREYSRYFDMSLKVRLEEY